MIIEIEIPFRLQENSLTQSDEFRRNSIQNNNCNEFFKRYLIRQNRYRLIVTRRSFKFRRKKSFHRVKNFNNNHTDDIPKRSIEEILNQQWMKTRKINRGTKSPCLID